MIADAAIVDPGGTVEVECLASVDQKWLAELFYILNAEHHLQANIQVRRRSRRYQRSPVWCMQRWAVRRREARRGGSPEASATS